jgi:transposase-like protein
MEPQSATSGILSAFIRETLERQCPHCLSDEVTPTGTVTASILAVHVGYQCHSCSKPFVLLRADDPMSQASPGLRTTA